jgi:hypothetical protein
MDIKASFQTTPSFVLRSYHACHPSAMPTRWGVAATGAALSLLTRSPLPFLVAVVIVAWFVASARRQLKKYLGGTRNVTIAIDTEAYRVTGQEGTARAFPWSTFTAIEQRRGFIVFRMAGGRAMALPEAALDAQQKRDLLEYGRQRGLVPSSH